MSENLVALPPPGLVIALQYWAGDEARAMRVARLLADIEPARRENVNLCFLRRYDCPESDLLAKTRLHVGFKFGTTTMRAEREATGHPDGCNALWASGFEQLAAAWRDGLLSAHSVFFAEADGVPLRADWLDRLIAAHAETLRAGKRVTGPEMRRYPHINGSIIAHLSLWGDRPSLHQTPPGQAWDMYHAQVLMAEARPSGWIQNVYGACDWSAASLAAMSKETAYLCSQKDDSALIWSERTLAGHPPGPIVNRPCLHLTDGQVCQTAGCPCPCLVCEMARRSAAGDEWGGRPGRVNVHG